MFEQITLARAEILEVLATIGLVAGAALLLTVGGRIIHWLTRTLN